MREAIDAGLTPDQVRQRVRSGAWRRVGRGAYLPSGDLPYLAMDRFDRQRAEHAHRALAAAARNPGSVIGHASAAYVHGMPMFGPVPREVVLLVARGAWTGHRSGIHFRRAALDTADVVELRSPVTSPARTWLDVSCRGTLSDSLVLGDAVVRSGHATRADLDGAFVRAGRIPGFRRAERALRLVDGIRETPLESASFAYFVEHGIRLPRMQVELVGPDGWFVARVDFLWDDVPGAPGLVGESDGVVKYGERGAAYLEKRREDAIRELGLLVVRWGFADLRTPLLARRLARILG